MMHSNKRKPTFGGDLSSLPKSSGKETRKDEKHKKEFTFLEVLQNLLSMTKDEEGRRSLLNAIKHRRDEK